MPASLNTAMSCMSPQMLRGALKALEATPSTIGSLRPEAMYNTSAMYTKPWLAVTVKLLAPVAEAPTRAEAAECSDSTCMYSASISPLATNSASFSAAGVEGVMG